MLEEQFAPLDLLNTIRGRVEARRERGYLGVTPITRASAQPLEQPRSGAQAFLLPAGSCRDSLGVGGSLPRRKAGDSDLQGQWHHPLRMQDGQRQRHDRRNGHDHRLAGAQQAGQYPGPVILGCRAPRVSEHVLKFPPSCGHSLSESIWRLPYCVWRATSLTCVSIFQ